MEAAERPGLAEDPRPVIIGRDPRQAPRAIVTTANDAARALGIHSGLSAAIALKRAPNALFLPPRRDVYERYSARVMAVLREASPLVEQNSIDEAACAWSHGFESGAALALRARILAETKISVSLGIATSALVAKMASEAAKSRTDHVVVVQPGEEAAFLAPLPVRALVGIGPKAERRVVALGITTIGDLAARPLEELVAQFGRAYGRYLHEASRGIAETELHAERTSKSISAEHTFSTDTTDRHVLWAELHDQAEEVAGRLKQEGLLAGHVAIKVRYANWQTFTRQVRLPQPTDDAETLSRGAAMLMRRNWDRTRAIRLIGLRAGKLVEADHVRQLVLPFE